MSKLENLFICVTPLQIVIAKRIIEEYHKGKIFVAKSTKETGTEFKTLLRK